MQQSSTGGSWAWDGKPTHSLCETLLATHTCSSFMDTIAGVNSITTKKNMLDVWFTKIMYSHNQLIMEGGARTLGCHVIKTFFMYYSVCLPKVTPAVGHTQWRGGVWFLSANSARLHHPLQQQPPHSTLDCLQADQNSKLPLTGYEDK